MNGFPKVLKLAQDDGALAYNTFPEIFTFPSQEVRCSEDMEAEAFVGGSPIKSSVTAQIPQIHPSAPALAVLLGRAGVSLAQRISVTEAGSPQIGQAEPKNWHRRAGHVT